LNASVTARGVNWLAEPPIEGARITARIRHRAPLAAGAVVSVSDEEIEIALDEPALAIAPGQSLVLYDGELVLGGGLIQPRRAALPVLAA
jgi:tRNA-uridine 2-sulfurtransferase